MKFLVLFLCLASTVFASLKEDKDQWANFKGKHGKLYQNLQEEKSRFSIFQQRLRTIEEHNRQYEAGNTTYRKGINRFSDLTKEEFVAFLNRKSSPKVESTSIYQKPAGLEVPDSIDWRDQGAVSPVKDQGSCGSCWAFSATGCLESYYYLKNKQMVLFSEQQLVDCDTEQYGCSGGWEGDALTYVKENGIETEDSYKYRATDGTCRYNKDALVDFTVNKVVALREKQEDDLVSAVGSIGPVTVAFDADDIFDYESGVFTSSRCSKTMLDHAVLAVGYGHDSATGLDYWIIKNSWAADWGENGFFRIRRGTDECGLSSENFYVVLD